MGVTFVFHFYFPDTHILFNVAKILFGARRGQNFVSSMHDAFVKDRIRRSGSFRDAAFPQGEGVP